MISNPMGSKRNRSGEDTWKWFIYFRVWNDENGNPFPDKGPRYIGFDGPNLIGYYHDLPLLERAYLKGVIHTPKIKFRDYKGIAKEILNAWI